MESTLCTVLGSLGLWAWSLRDLQELREYGLWERFEGLHNEVSRCWAYGATVNKAAALSK